MRKFMDLTGEKYGRLTVRSRSGHDNHRKITWECVCECGNIITTAGNSLRTGNTTSCGCVWREAIARRVPVVRIKHGLSKQKGYSVWNSMMSRCYNDLSASYNRYGARGIRVCERWHNPANFIADMGDPPFAGAELDREDVNGNYEPENCRWVTKKVNANNKTSNRYYEYEGEKLTLSQLSEKSGIPYYSLDARIKRGWPLETAMTAKINTRVNKTRNLSHLIGTAHE